MQCICVFCGSCAGGSVYVDASRRFGTALARRGLGLVYGGGHIGLMGVVADAVLAAGGTVVGVIPRFLVEKELVHTRLTELVMVETMHQRKAIMADRADAFAALPGGFGTADELFEILTWAQLGVHEKPIGLLNVGGFFDLLLAWLDQCVRAGFLSQENRELLRISTDCDHLLEMLMCEPVAPSIRRRNGPSGLRSGMDSA